MFSELLFKMDFDNTDRRKMLTDRLRATGTRVN